MRAVDPIAKTTLDQVVGCLRSKRKATIAQMERPFGKRFNGGMTAVDTNVVVRLLTADDKEQTEAVALLFDSEPIWISKTVLLEISWVLSSLYEFGQNEIGDAYNKLIGLTDVHIEDRHGMLAALRMAGLGVDLADAIHLMGSPSGAAFVSFDKTFIRRAKRAGASDVLVVPPAER